MTAPGVESGAFLSATMLVIAAALLSAAVVAAPAIAGTLSTATTAPSKRKLIRAYTRAFRTHAVTECASAADGTTSCTTDFPDVVQRLLGPGVGPIPAVTSNCNPETNACRTDCTSDQYTDCGAFAIACGNNGGSVVPPSPGATTTCVTSPD